MKPFIELTKSGQVRRLGQMARVALTHYDINVRKVSPIYHGENTTFRVKAREGEFVLRINRPNRHTTAIVASEMQWLADLREHSYLQVPKPVRNKLGSLYVNATVDGVPETRSCVLFEWLEGRIYGNSPTVKLMKEVGRATAVLHNFVSDYQLPKGFDRPDVTWEGEGGISLKEGLEAGVNFLNKEDVDTYLETLAYVQKTADSAGRTPTTFGLIHADLHLHNCLFHRGDIRIIDFDDCGFGYFTQDLGISLWYLRNRSDFADLRAGLLEGYVEKRPLTAIDEKLIHAFKLNRTVDLAMWLASRVDHPEYREMAPDWVAARAKELRSEISKV